MAQLPYLQSAIDTLNELQNKWKSLLDPLLSAPQPKILTGIILISGTNVINHKLGRKLIGWSVIGKNGTASIYDAQQGNLTPQFTLVLISNATVTINLEVF